MDAGGLAGPGPGTRRTLFIGPPLSICLPSATPSDRSDGVEFVDESDGSVTARDLETGLARGGETRATALARLTEVLELHEGGERFDDPDEFLKEELDLTVDDLADVDERNIPDVVR